MNAMQMLSVQPWVARLGWTLIHFLWQGLAIAILYAVARRTLASASSPQLRYRLSCLALAAMMAAPVVTWARLHPSAETPDVTYRIRSAPPSAAIARTLQSPTFVQPAVSNVPAQFLSWVVMVWFVGMTVFWARLTGGWVVAARMRSVTVRSAPPECQKSLRRLCIRIGLSRPVRLLVSALVEVPTVVGWLRPVVLVPVGALSGLPAEQLEALLLHELAHIRRHDYLVNILQSIAEAVLFYHPAVWWVSANMRAERELCCDDMAVSVSGDAFTFAHALAQLEACRPAHLHRGLAANGGSLSVRIARLLGQTRPASRAGPGPGVVAVGVLLGIAAYTLLGQTNQHPAFEVASIKRNTAVWSDPDPTHHPMGVRRELGGRLTAKNAPLILLIQRAYAVQAFQVVAGPAWINTDGYDIEAKPEGAADFKQVWPMLQTLLADRCKLTLHREARDLPVYELKAARRGPKLPASKAVNCAAEPPDGIPVPPPRGQALCGYVAGPMGFAGVSGLEGSKVRMADFISKLALILGRPVLDKTGFTGDFDLKLHFTADEATMGLPGFGGPGDPYPNGPRAPTDPNRPNIFAALEEQLGLKLVSAKGPVDVLVIDHVERPSPN